MNITEGSKDDHFGSIALFRHTFATSEGAEEGAVIAELVRDIFASTDPDDLHIFIAKEGEELAGCILFTRLSFPEDQRRVFLLSPVAVAPSFQRKGTGQALLSYGLYALRKQGIDAVITYGDPAYYSKVGFEQITEAQAQAPMPLQFPEGWLGQRLSGEPFDAIKGPSYCVAAFNNPEIW